METNTEDEMEMSSPTRTPSLSGSTGRPSRVEQGVLLAARWLIEYDLPYVAASMLRYYGLDGCDLRKMEKQDIEILARLNITEGTRFILPNDQGDSRPTNHQTT